MQFWCRSRLRILITIFCYSVLWGQTTNLILWPLLTFTTFMTDRHTYRHGNSVTDPAQRAESVTIIYVNPSYNTWISDSAIFPPFLDLPGPIVSSVSRRRQTMAPRWHHRWRCVFGQGHIWHDGSISLHTTAHQSLLKTLQCCTFGRHVNV